MAPQRDRLHAEVEQLAQDVQAHIAVLRQAAEMRSRAEQLQAENARLTKLVDEQLSKLTSDIPRVEP